MTIHSGISFNLDPPLIRAALPLFEQGEIEALEWSFDALFRLDSLPDWFDELLQSFGAEGRLVGHGIYFSLFSGKWMPEQDQWLKQLAEITSRYSFAHITEHFGFVTGADFHKGAPMWVPFTEETLAIGQDRLQRIAQACQCPVGLENLAFSPHPEAAEKHGHFIQELVKPIHGFLILDLHNLYCQLVNFDWNWEKALASLPLELVREVHISGGSWEPSPFKGMPGVRRDTHNDRVPGPVFTMLEAILSMLPNLQFVFLEQMGSALETDAEQQAFQSDFRKMKSIVQQFSPNPHSPAAFLPPTILDLPAPLESETLRQQQELLSRFLEDAATYQELQDRLAQSNELFSRWEWDKWHPAMLETAWKIARKWKEGF